MIDRDERLPVTSQCELLDVARSTVYYQPKPTPAGDIDLMRRIDEIHLTHPFLGSRRMVDALADNGFVVNRKKVVRLMRIMGLAALYPKRRTTIPAVGHRIYPYLLRGLKIDRPNQVWCADVTYLPMAHGFMYLVAVMDWYSRKVLCWRLSNTMDTSFCIDASPRRSKPTALRKCSTPTKARSSPARHSPACSTTTASPSAWMVGAGGWTTYSSNGFGAASNTKRSTSRHMRTAPRPGKGSATTSSSTTADDVTRP
jgi:HTH-like domain/Integrase core domain